MPPEINFEKIRPINGSRHTAFEKLCCQLAKDCAQPKDPDAKFVPKGDPDAGIECYWELSDGDAIGWQAKFFTSPPDSSQWSQIDRSVKRAVDNHSNLTEYVICIPLDRADPRVEEQQWFMDKWEKHVEKWEGWQSGITYEYWGSFELTEFLSQDSQRGRRYYWFEEEGLNSDKVRRFAEEQISNAHTRYSREVNVSLSIEELFDGLGRTFALQEDIEERKKRLERQERTLSNFDSVDDEIRQEILSGLRRTIELISQPDTVEDPFPVERIEENVEPILDKIDRLLQRDQASSKQQIDGANRRTLRSTRVQLGRTNSFFHSNRLRLANHPILYVSGMAGVGKTHLFCDIAEKRTLEGKPTLLFLGEHFSKGDIWYQMINQVGLDCTPEELLGALNTYGEVQDERALILIDGLNESEPRDVWKNRLNGILRRVNRYPYVGIAFSCRTGFEQNTLPTAFDDTISPIRVRHGGFENQEQEAAKIFFEHYGLESGSVPLLLPAFQNPLFLKLFCKTLYKQGRTQVPKGLSGATQLFESFVATINEDLADQLDYDPSENHIESAILELASIMAERNSKFIPKSTAKKSVNKFLPDRGKFSNTLYFGMQKEDLLVERDPYKEEEETLVRFQFERFADHYIVENLLDGHFDKEDAEQAFRKSSKLYEVFVNGYDDGLLESLAIQLPEKYDIEIFELLEGQRVLEAFLRGLSWRAPETLLEGGELKEEVEQFIFQNIDSRTQDTLFETLILLSGKNDHPMNADYLHQLLDSLSIPDRDQNWSVFLHNSTHEGCVVDRLISWAERLDDSESFTKETKHLYGKVLSWFLTTSCRPIRDRATKGLVKLFDDTPREIIALLNEFRGIDDVYVIERLYAAAYGIVLRNPQHDSIPEIASYVFDREFDDGKPIPHLLARDYARGIIETALYHQKISISRSAIRPGYECDWPFSPPTSDELNSLRQSLLDDATSEEARQQIQSVWGDLVGRESDGTGWSDFSRYIVGTNSKSEFEHFDFQMADGLRWMVKRMTDVGWEPNKCASFDRRLKQRPRGRMENRASETFRKKYQWIAYHQLIAFLSDSSMKTDDEGKPLFEGPWQLPYRRDIDPSMVPPTVGDPEHDVESPVEYDCKIEEESAESWVSNSEEYPNITSLLRRESAKSSYLPLYQYLRQTVDSDVEDFRRLFFCHAYGHIIAEQDRSDFVSYIQNNWVDQENIDLHNIRSVPTLTDSFVGEYPWHPSAAHDPGSISDCPVDAVRTPVDLNWEFEYDASVQGKYGMFAPTHDLFIDWNLSWDFDTYNLVENDTELKIFDPSLEPLGELDIEKGSAILASEDAFRTKLDQQETTIVWVILGEKNVTYSAIPSDLGYLRIRGVYWLEEDGIKGVDQAEFVNSGGKPSGKSHHTPDPASPNDDSPAFLQEPLEVDFPVIKSFTDIDGIGTKKADKLREAGFDDFDDLFYADKADLEAINGIGPKLADEINRSAFLHIIGSKHLDINEQS